MSATLTTNGAVLSRHKISTEGIEHLDLEVEILSAPQAQGDVVILLDGFVLEDGTVVHVKKPAAVEFKPIPKAGITVVRGETTGGNSHILHNLDGESFWAASPRAGEELVQGWMLVPDECSTTLIHTQEHNVLGHGPGLYEIRRQREFAGEWRRVSD